MGRFIRFTCAKKNEPVYRDDCMCCPEYNPCGKNGKWCFVGALVAEQDPIYAEIIAPLAEEVAAPVMRDMSTVTINLGDGKKVDILREDIKKQLEREFYNGIGFMYGA